MDINMFTIGHHMCSLSLGLSDLNQRLCMTLQAAEPIMGNKDPDTPTIGHPILHISMIGELITLIIDMLIEMLTVHLHIIETCHIRTPNVRNLVERLYTLNTLLAITPMHACTVACTRMFHTDALTDSG